MQRTKFVVPGCGPIKPLPDCDTSRSYPIDVQGGVEYHCVKDEFCWSSWEPKRLVCTVERVEVYHCIKVKIKENE